MTGKLKAWLLLASAIVLAACGDVEPPDESVYAVRDFGEVPQAPCSDSEPTRRALFGDLHVHTSISNDAWNFGVRSTPDDAYRYAFGGDIKLPLDGDPERRTVRIDRPLDFVGVTDHAEFFGEQSVCQDPFSPGYNGELCDAMRNGDGRAPALLMKIFSPFSKRDADVCGEDGEECARRSEATWADTVAAAQRWDDRSEGCERTTFVAYEYSSVRMGSNLHRNVIFRNAIVPARPVSYFEAHREWDLWRILKSACIDGSPECDVLAIPHNSNISNGRMFNVDYHGASGRAEQAARARLRAELEPVVEMMQHKGDSECSNGIEGVLGGVDELCNFEPFEAFAHQSVKGEGSVMEPCYEGPFRDWVPRLGPSCMDRRSYVRYALIEGLMEEERIGVNPFKFGLSASTDTHNALAGGVEEASFPGHLGNGDAAAVNRVQFKKEIAGNASNNPGGLIGVWAEHNDRDAIFDAMQRREVFGTSGPRIEPRFFGGRNLPADLCDDPAMLETAYELAVPMGSDLPRGRGAPSFLVAASADAGTESAPGMPLQQLQVIKGWYDADGNHHQKVIEVAGDADNGASVDLATCETDGEGFRQLCTVWEDREFDPRQAAVYYLRAVENPSCRYTAHQCLTIPEDERPPDCADPMFSHVIQERAWSSPIWYTPRR